MKITPIYQRFSFTTICFYQIRVFDTMIIVDLQKDMKKINVFWWNMETRRQTPMKFVKGG